jgi:NADPH-dependent ferric siderophore reductase
MAKPRAESRLSAILRRAFMRRAAVTACDALGGGFHLITLESPAFQDLDWTPGDKIQIALGSAFVARTYTPIDWDAVAGRTRVLAYAHGVGPGSDWIGSLKTGDTCDVFGPRASLDVSWLPGPVLMLGDETTFGLALAMRQQSYADSVEFVFEVNDHVRSRRLLDALAFGSSRLIERRADDRHLEEIEAELLDRARCGATFVLTGRSIAIQRLRRALKPLDVPATLLLTKAYWAPGKTGLD